MSLVVADFLLCGWPIVGTDFSELVHVPGGTNLGWSKLNVTVLIGQTHMQSLQSMCNTYSVLVVNVV